MSGHAEADEVHWDELAVWRAANDTGRGMRMNSNNKGIATYLPTLGIQRQGSGLEDTVYLGNNGLGKNDILVRAI